MILSHKPKSLLRLLISPTSLTLKWVSTITAKTCIPLHQNALDHLQSLYNAKPEDQKNRDYELAMVSALKSCATHLFIPQGQQLHSLVFISGLKSNTFIQNSLINMYAKCGLMSIAESLFYSCSRLDPVSCNIMIAGYVKSGRLNDAHKLFEIMPDKGCVSYTTMIMGFAQNEFWFEAIEVYKDMRNVGVVPNEVTLASVMSACTRLGGIWDCRTLHGLAIQMNFNGWVIVSTNLLQMYCIFSSLEEARSLFDEMPERNTVSWNVMLNGYAKAGLVKLARELFEWIPEKDVVSWGTLLDGYVKVECLSEALMTYGAMIRDGVGPTEVMVVDLVSACGRSLAFWEGQQLHSVIVKSGFDCCDFIQSTIIHFYAACGKIDLACLQFEVGIKDHLASWNALIAGYIRNGMIELAGQMFNKMPGRDVFSWSAMIAGYTQSEQPDIALELFHEMIASGIQPNQITMVSVFSAIASLGTLKEGRWAHEYVSKNSIPLNDNLSAAIIDMYAKCGSINCALKVFYQIRDKSSTVSPWNAIICGLAVHGHANLSLRMYSDLQKRLIKLNSITFIGVLSACCHAGLVDLELADWKKQRSL
ncbi:PPR domain-containing protein/PPR_1 domain-containing protein/PPR_2 domain-containing protein [Cephalotus follicularis]|uniref:PPR domain-containing protein/PPR_1 domain-containing protein/PPR_2 domain-containing protein n=1 Tax=Cephalotus follicularis TaxID=3775 RepID=A0A1Q3AZ39_CEPFO|nr:PPR domain-containing protein/PPR_1 domain-containing protein/PPR_2 domain-containing protein [Cephalotus follicularis]